MLHVLPLWFLVVALFLPRIALLCAWVEGDLVPFHVFGWVPVILAVVVPRIMILVLIYRDQGLSGWFLVHAIVMLMVWGGIGGNKRMRRRRED